MHKPTNKKQRIKSQRKKLKLKFFFNFRANEMKMQCIKLCRMQLEQCLERKL